MAAQPFINAGAILDLDNNNTTLGGLKVEWRARPVSERRSNLGDSGDPGVFTVAVYEIEVAVEQLPDVPRDTFLIRQLGFERQPYQLDPFSAPSSSKKFCWPAAPAFPNILLNLSRVARVDMKAKIIITPKKAVLDPQGKTVQSALEHMGYKGVTAVHVGKYLEIELAPGTNAATARQALNAAAQKFLSNPVIEDFTLEIE